MLDIDETAAERPERASALRERVDTALADGFGRPEGFGRGQPTERAASDPNVPLGPRALDIAPLLRGNATPVLRRIQALYHVEFPVRVPHPETRSPSPSPPPSPHDIRAGENTLSHCGILSTSSSRFSLSSQEASPVREAPRRRQTARKSTGRQSCRPAKRARHSVSPPPPPPSELGSSRSSSPVPTAYEVFGSDSSDSGSSSHAVAPAA